MLAEMERRITSTVERGVAEVRRDLERHLGDIHAHPDSDKEDRQRLTTLWDERNTTRGMVRVLSLVYPLMVVIVPVLTALLVWYLGRRGP